MTWLLTNTAREHRLVDYYAQPAANPTPYTPPLGEIGHSLAHINRFTGHACRAYSVAEHSLLVADMAVQDGHGYMVEICALMHDAHESITGDVSTPVKQMLGNAWARFENAQQHALMHDAHESITGDVSTPVKQMLGNAWARFENAQQHALLAAYGLVVDMEQHKALIKHYDLKALATERRDLLPFNATVHTPWPLIDTPHYEIQPCADVDLMCKERVAKTPAAWANEWKWRTASLFAIVHEQARASAKEAA